MSGRRLSPAAWVLALPIRVYRLIFSPWVGHNCRYDPTCSAYILEALEKHGALRGFWLSLRRVARCHPWGGMGVDDVPPARGARHPDGDQDAAAQAEDRDPER
ncbi:membrane protein insertion efficiency factor YidD [Pseudooceanicola marinus]|uniref:membrane protein insertion efficiency factor YidD n=1 Tax=Pseudooceanicola marinus TaxID=396013 RepID=UPI001CD69FE6|nr:membrane protein insertion efficiency factor YidD [Pseudooceanicola marinus]MCA1337461.1 membrane protein insertion efficiency factor YidD [Pseudooceanicola marinus]